MTGHAELVRASSRLLDDVDRGRLVDALTEMPGGVKHARRLPAGRLGAILSISDALTGNERRSLAIDIAGRPSRRTGGRDMHRHPGHASPVLPSTILNLPDLHGGAGMGGTIPSGFVTSVATCTGLQDIGAFFDACLGAICVWVDGHEDEVLDGMNRVRHGAHFAGTGLAVGPEWGFDDWRLTGEIHRLTDLRCDWSGFPGDVALLPPHRVASHAIGSISKLVGSRLGSPAPDASGAGMSGPLGIDRGYLRRYTIHPGRPPIPCDDIVVFHPMCDTAVMGRWSGVTPEARPVA